jgi:hypothetical protein
MRTRPTKRERIDEWLKGKKAGYRFYSKQLGDALGLSAMEVVPYLKWHKRIQLIGDCMKGPNWLVV